MMCRRLSLERARIFGIRNDMNHDQSGLHDVTVCVRCMAMGAVGWGGECIASPSHGRPPSHPFRSRVLMRDAAESARPLHPPPPGMKQQTPFPMFVVALLRSMLRSHQPPGPPGARRARGAGRFHRVLIADSAFAVPFRWRCGAGGQREPRRTAVCIRSPVYRIAAAVRLERCGLDLLVLVLS